MRLAKRNPDEFVFVVLSENTLPNWTYDVSKK